MKKLYQRINWQNYPSDSTPLNESNLNKMDAAVDGIDDRVVTLDVVKLPVATANTMVKDVTFNESTGVFTITKLNGTKVTVNTALEKIATNFRYDYSTQKLILTLVDGTTQEVDLSALLTQYEFLNSSTIQFTIDSSGKVKASVVNGSITGDMLEPNYLANVTLQASKADTSAKNAKESEEKAAEYAENAKNSADSAEPVASTATGTNPTIKDSTNAPFIYGKFKGCTEQQTYSGKNIFDVNKKSLGDFDSNGDFVIPSSTGVFYEYAFKENTQYTFSAYVKNSITTSNVRLSITYTDGTKGDALLNGTTEYVYTKFTSAAEKTIKQIRISYSNNGLMYIKGGELQIEEGTTATPYEPYVGGIASPNPDYPQEINGLAKDGAIEVKTCGKNLINPVPNSVTNNGVTFTKQENKSYMVSGNIENATVSSYITILSNKSLPIGEYILSGGVDANAHIRLIKLTDGEAARNYYTYGEDVEFSITNQTSTITMILVLSKDATVASQIFKPMIRPAEIADDTYEPYTEITANIPIDEPLYEEDYIEVYADGSGKLVRTMAEVVLDGSDDELWFAYTDVIFQSRKILNASIPIWGNINKQKSSHFYVGYADGDGDDCFSINNNDMLTIRYNSVTTLEDFKTWLQSNPVTVVYKLAKPTETPLTAEQVEQFKKLYTFEPVTNVLCDGEVEMRYYKANVNGETVGMLQEQTKDFAKKAIYGDTTINVGRKEGSFVGDCSTAEGYGTTASGDYAHAEGMGTTASGDYAHAEGKNTTASGLDSHSEGYGTTASGDYSHAEGMGTTASGDYSHAEGMGTTASGLYSHVEGNGTIAHGNSQHVQGKYNVEDTEDKYVHIVGGGTFKKRKNIHTLDWDGNAEFAGNVLGHDVNGNSVSLSNINRYLGRIDLGMYATQNTYDFTSFAGYDRYTLVFKGTDANRSLFTRELLTIHNIEKNTSNVGKVCLNISNNYTFEPWVEMYPSRDKTYIVVGITDTTGLTTLVSSLFVEVYGAMD